MKKGERKERISLTLLYSAISFCILLLSVLIAAALSYLLAKLELLTFLSVEEGSVHSTLLFMVLVSAIVGIVITLLTRKIPLNPFNKLINHMNRLATGDFKVRLTFGKVAGGIPAFTELSDSFNTMAQELESTELLRSDFVNNFSHEFKTPIVSIAGFAKLLRRGNLSDEQKDEYLAIIEEESLRLSAMATNVLNLTKLENQTILTDCSTYNLSEQIRSCVLLLENRWSQKNLSLDLEFEEYQITANEEMLKQVWINLLDNAVKFSPPTGEVIVRVAENTDALTVSVTNFGSEIPADKLDKIWGKFYQADESHASLGNGVGLAVVKYIVGLHKGTAFVQSEAGKTTFIVKLPK